MSPRPLRLATSGLPAMLARQMSRQNGLAKGFAPVGGRGRVQVYRPQPVRDIGRDEFLRWWSGLMLRKLGTAHAIARRFDCTEQTGRNWIDGFSCPTGLQVMRAHDWWPDEFGRATGWMRGAA